MIAKTMMLEKHEYYAVHLSIVNCFLPVKLKPKEITVLSYFMAFDDNDKYGMFNSQHRKVVRRELNLSYGGLSNYLIALKDKGFVTGRGDKIEIIPLLQPNGKEENYRFKLINIDNNE